MTQSIKRDKDYSSTIFTYRKRETYNSDLVYHLGAILLTISLRLHHGCETLMGITSNFVVEYLNVKN